MIDKKFLKTIDKAVASILEGRLSEAFALLRTAAPEVDAPGLAADIDKLEKRYYYFLRFIGESSGEFSPEKISGIFPMRRWNLWGKLSLRRI